MRRFVAPIFLLALSPTQPALAQAPSTLELGIPNDTVFVRPAALTEAFAADGHLVLVAHPGFLPVIQDYATGAPPEGVSASVCGMALPPFQPNAEMVSGRIMIPMDQALAEDAALAVMETITCDAFLANRNGAGDAGATVHQGLTLASPTDSRDVAPDELVAAEATRDPALGSEIIVLEFGPDLTDWMATETAEHIGDPISISVCGEVLTAPIVNEAIRGGGIVISGNFTKEETDLTAARINGLIPCDE